MKDPKATKVVEMSYFYYHKRILRYLGVDIIGPGHSWIYKLVYYSYTFIILILSIGCTASLWLEVPNLMDDIDGMMFNLTFGITYITAYIKMICYVWNQKLILEVINTSESKNLQAIGHSDKITAKARRVSIIMFKCIALLANLSGTAIFVGGVFKNSYQQQNSPLFSMKMPFPMKIPFEITSNFRYVVGFIYQVLGILLYGNIVIALNTLMIAIIIHLSYKFSNLSLSLNHIRKIAIIKLATGNDSYVDLDDLTDPLKYDYYENIIQDALNKFTTTQINLEMTKCMKLCIMEHCDLIKSVKKFEIAYNIGFLAHICNNLNIICHLMIQVSENDMFSFRGGTAITLIGCVVSEFAALNYAGNELTLQAAKVARCIYDCEWVETDKTFKKMLCIMLMRAQNPVVLTAGKFITISNSSFVLIVRGAYSYFAVIKNTNV